LQARPAALGTTPGSPLDLLGAIAAAQGRRALAALSVDARELEKRANM